MAAISSAALGIYFSFLAFSHTLEGGRVFSESGSHAAAFWGCTAHTDRPWETKNLALAVSQPGIGLVCTKGMFCTAASVLVSPPGFDSRMSQASIQRRIPGKRPRSTPVFPGKIVIDAVFEARRSCLSK